MSLLDLLKLPETKTDAFLDSPDVTENRRQIIAKKYFLRKIYKCFYKKFSLSLGEIARSGKIVEIGSGGGFIKEVLPQVKTSEVFFIPKIDLVFNATCLPFKDQSVSAFFMLDVFHHVKDVALFINEANRCLVPGGIIFMIEPANTWWGRIVFKYLHFERYDDQAGWTIEGLGPLSDSNTALPWMVFKRDREIFQKKWPQIQIKKYEAHTPFSYLVSGGVSLRQLLPDFCFPLVRGLEFLLSPINFLLGMFVTIKLQKVGS